MKAPNRVAVVIHKIGTDVKIIGRVVDIDYVSIFIKDSSKYFATISFIVKKIECKPRMMSRQHPSYLIDWYKDHLLGHYMSSWFNKSGVGCCGDMYRDVKSCIERRKSDAQALCSSARLNGSLFRGRCCLW